MLDYSVLQYVVLGVILGVGIRHFLRLPSYAETWDMMTEAVLYAEWAKGNDKMNVACAYYKQLCRSHGIWFPAYAEKKALAVWAYLFNKGENCGDEG